MAMPSSLLTNLTAEEPTSLVLAALPIMRKLHLLLLDVTRLIIRHYSWLNDTCAERLGKEIALSGKTLPFVMHVISKMFRRTSSMFNCFET